MKDELTPFAADMKMMSKSTFQPSEAFWRMVSSRDAESTRTQIAQLSREQLLEYALNPHKHKIKHTGTGKKIMCLDLSKAHSHSKLVETRNRLKAKLEKRH